MLTSLVIGFIIGVIVVRAIQELNSWYTWQTYKNNIFKDQDE
jgi:hypothetical protein